MKRAAILAVLALIVSVPAFGADEKDLSGAWVGVEATNSGMKSDDLAKDSKMVFADGKLKSALGDLTVESTYKVDRSKKPNTLDTKPVTGGRNNRPMQAIFELDGDTLRICYAFSGERPKDFTSTAENKQFLVVYKRSK